MNRRQLLIAMCSLLAVGLLGAGALAMSLTGFDLSWHVIAGGGGHSSSAEYAVSGSIGQPAVGGLSAANYGLDAGFWPGIGAETPTPTPTGTVPPTSTPTATRTPTPTVTGTLPPTSTPTPTPTPTPTVTGSPPPTSTPTATPTATPTGTVSPMPTATATVTPTTPGQRVYLPIVLKSSP